MVCYDGLSGERCTVLSLLKMQSKTIAISFFFFFLDVDPPPDTLLA